MSIISLYSSLYSLLLLFEGWSGGAMVLGKLPVPGCPTIRITVGRGPTCACSRGGWALFGHFSLVYPSHLCLPLFGRRTDIDCNTVSKGR